MTDWHNKGTVRIGWSDAPRNDDELDDLLDSAKVQCGVYAGLFTQEEADAAEMDGTLAALVPTIPSRVRVAHALQVQALWTRKQTAGSDAYGGDGFTVREYDMSKRIRRLLRPETGKPRVG